MKPPVWLLGTLLVVNVPALRAGIDFTPRTLEREEDGLRVLVTYVVPAPGERATVAPPVGWKLGGGAGGLHCFPADLPGGSVTLRPSPLGDEAPAFDVKGLELYRRRVLADVPPGATGARIVGERPEPLGLTGWKTHEFVVAWELGGQFWQQSLIFVTLGPRQAMVGTASGLRGDHAALRDALTRLLSSWSREAGN